MYSFSKATPGPVSPEGVARAREKRAQLARCRLVAEIRVPQTLSLFKETG